MKKSRICLVKIEVFFLMAFFVGFSLTSSAFEISPGNLKAGIRKVLSQVVEKPPVESFGRLPEGLTIIEGKGYRGLKAVQGKLELRVHTWSDDTGLLENYKLAKESGMEIVAAVNGTFYSSRGILGQAVSDGALPHGIQLVPGLLSRCFLATFRAAKGRQFWYLGETSLQPSEVVRFSFKEKAWFNVPEIYDGTIDNLIGGGGWIMRNRKDVHMESYERQRFRFRKEDQTARKTVIAQDSERNLYFIVFEDGFTFHMVARTFAKEEVFAHVREAVFLDGGSSSAIVLKDKYLVPPLYMLDRARFSCIQIIVPPTTW